MARTYATATVARSVGVAVAAFAAAVIAAAADATAAFRVVYGLSGQYGRYFAAADPLIAYAAAASDVASLITQGVAQRDLVAAAAADAASAATGTAAQQRAAIAALAEALRAACAAPADALRLLSALAGFDPPVVALGQDAIAAEIGFLAANAAVAMRRAAAISLARASKDYLPISQQDAAGRRSALADILDQIATEAADRFEDEAYAALDALRLAVVADLDTRGGNLAPVVTHDVARPLPSLILAYRWYGDAARADDLVARNNPPHPGFMPRAVEALAA